LSTQKDRKGKVNEGDKKTTPTHKGGYRLVIPRARKNRHQKRGKRNKGGGNINRGGGEKNSGAKRCKLFYKKGDD